ncbi:MAG: GxxExxY protein [Candidatus Stygibacter frigidus]|nr:GxxExxY protein [Candidatus Stygibacter frigidus]
MDNLLYKKECFEIQGAIFNVYRNMGCGFLESVYQECLEIELLKAEIPFKSQVEISLDYNGIILEQKYRADFVCYDKIILEIKAVKALDDVHTAQVINYLKAIGYKLGLLVNFGSFPKVEIKRIVLEKKKNLSTAKGAK